MVKTILVIGLLIIYLPRLRGDVIRRILASKIVNFKFVFIEPLILVIALFGIYQVEVHSVLISCLGLSIFSIGVVLATISRFTLKEDYLPAFAMCPPQKIVTIGPYKIVRHPVYLGMVLVIIGFILTVSHSFLIIVLLPIYFFVIQIKEEEKMLSKHCGANWISLKNKTKFRLIPFLW